MADSSPRLPRRLALALLWTACVVAATLAIGMRVRAHRLADPVQALRPYLRWLPDDIGAHAVLIGRSSGEDGVAMQFEILGTAAEIRAFAAHEGLSAVDGRLLGGGAERWESEVPTRPGAVVHLLLPDSGGPGLLTVLDPGDAAPDRRPSRR